MKPGRLALVELVAWVTAFALMVVAVAAVDWRAGAFLAGVLIVLSLIDIPRRRT